MRTQALNPGPRFDGLVPRCEVCGRDVDMPYSCSYCGDVHCEDHRLPESHGCAGADEAAEARRERQRTGHPGVEVEGGWTATDRGRASRGSGLWAKLQGNVAKYLLATIGVVYLLEWLALAVGGNPLLTRLFVLDATWWTKPWTLVTSVVAHDPYGFGHILVNGIILFFFGPLLEKQVGSKRFLYLIVAGGVLAGVTQVGFYSTFLGDARGVLGLSGGLMAVMGALTVLGPHLRVLVFFVIPAPLWVMMVGYAAIDLLGFLGGGGGIAHLAHLTGLALGLAAGWRWRQDGLAFRRGRGQVQGGRAMGRQGP